MNWKLLCLNILKASSWTYHTFLIWIICPISLLIYCRPIECCESKWQMRMRSLLLMGQMLSGGRVKCVLSEVENCVLGFSVSCLSAYSPTPIWLQVADGFYLASFGTFFMQWFIAIPEVPLRLTKGNEIKVPYVNWVYLISHNCCPLQ